MKPTLRICLAYRKIPCYSNNSDLHRPLSIAPQSSLHRPSTHTPPNAPDLALVASLSTIHSRSAIKKALKKGTFSPPNAQSTELFHRLGAPNLALNRAVIPSQSGLVGCRRSKLVDFTQSTARVIRYSDSAGVRIGCWVQCALAWAAAVDAVWVVSFSL